MGNAKTIKFLIACIAAICAIHFFISFQGAGDPLVSRTTLLASSAMDADGITVERRGERDISLLRREGWTIESPYHAPAAERPIKRLVDALTLSHVRSVFSEQDLLKFGRTKEDYGLTQPSLRVKLTVKGVEHSIGFGVKTPVGDGVFAVVDADQSVYVVGTNVLEAVNLSPENFRIRSLCMDPTRVVDRFDLKRGAGFLQCFRESDGIWSRIANNESDHNEVASSVKIRELLNELRRAQASEFVWPVGTTGETEIVTTSLLASYGLEPENAATITLHAAGRDDERISFGGKAPDGKVYALIQNGRAIATVDASLGRLAHETDFVDARLFPVERESIVRIAIADGDVNYLMAKDEKGEWLLDSPIAAPTDPAVIDRLVSNILGLKTDDRDEDGLKVSLSTNAPAENVSRNAVLKDIALSDLRSRGILKLENSDIRRITIIANGSEKIASLVADKDLDVWRREIGEESKIVNAQFASEVLATINPLVASRIVTLKVKSGSADDYGLESPRWTVAIDTVLENDLRRNILIGNETEDGYYATLGASDAVFVLPKRTVVRLVLALVREEISQLKGVK